MNAKVRLKALAACVLAAWGPPNSYRLLKQDLPALSRLHRLSRCCVAPTTFFRCTIPNFDLDPSIRPSVPMRFPHQICFVTTQSMALQRVHVQTEEHTYTPHKTPY